MQSLFKKLWRSITQMQVLAVFLAFAFMVFLSYHFMSEIVRKNIFNSVENAIKNTQSHIEADLMEPITSLGIVSDTVHGMLSWGAKDMEISDFLLDMTKYIKNNKRFSDYAFGFYGYFDVFGGTMLPDDGRVVFSDYDPTERPWFIAAVEAHDEIAISDPYVNLSTGEVTVALSRQIFDDNGNRFAIVCFDFKLKRIGEYAIETSVTDDSYGILIDKNFNVLAHPHPAYLGKHVSLMNDGFAVIEELRKEGKISERKARDYNNKNSVLFARRLNNGWYLAVLTYADKYYKSVMDIAYILIAIAFVLAVILSSILLSMITAKKRAEERTQAMLDATPLSADLWDKNFNIIDCNKEALKLFGFKNKKDYIEKFDELSPEYQPDGKLSKAKCIGMLEKTFADGNHRVEWLHRNLKGDFIPCEVSLVRVKIRDDYIVCAYKQDLREMKAVMTKMREADECTQILFDTSPLSCIMMDSSFNVIECNQEITRLFEIPDKQIFFDKVFSFSPEYQPSGEQSKEKLLRYINEAFEEGYCRFEWMHQKLDGEQIPAEVFFVRVKFRGMYAVAGYIRDLREIKAMIAEMRRAEIAEESSKAKSDFLAKMSHEIRTPMNAILGIAEIQLQDNTLPLGTKEALERIYNSGDLLLGIINDILDLSKIEAGKLEIVKAQYDIASLIHDIAKLNIIRYESKPIEFKVNVNENVPKILIGDELRIKQILNNLLSNAFKYTQEGVIELSLEIEPPLEDSKIMVVFCVKDTGQGMTREQVKQLGEKYTQFNMEANRKTEGTGLGMNITRNLISLMGGQIHVESTPGVGSVFMVKLLQEFTDNKVIGIELAENLRKLNLKTPSKMRNVQINQEFMPYGRVLVVDDVETNLYVARGLMAPYGLSIDTALSGFEAIDKIKDGMVYDVIFMDHMMPKMDGIEAVKIIREYGYDHPIAALTANALAGQAEVFFKNGFNDFVSKPIDIRQLNNILNKYVRDKQPQDILDEARRQKNSLYAMGGQGIAIDHQLAEFFVRDAEKAVNILETICENNCRRADDLPIFIINIHAMKSALANVGEKDLSKDAMHLEQSGREQNIKLIISQLPEFLVKLKGVIDRLKPQEEQDEFEDSENMDDFPDKPFLQEKLLIIQASCASMDKKAAKEAVMALKQRSWPRPVKDMLSTISEHLLHSEFEEAAAIARKVFFT